MFAGVVTALAAAGTMFAYAGGWALTDNAASITTNMAKMPRGVEPSVAKQNGQGVVSWTAQEISPAVLMDHYIVTAHRAGSSAGPDVTRTIIASGGATESATFTATELAGGTWNWTITPRFREWIGDASRKSRDLQFPAAPAARSAEPAVSASASPSGSPSPAASSSTPTIRSSPSAEDPTKVPEKQPETETPEPVRSEDPPPQPVESAGSGVEAPPAAQ